MLNCFLIHTEAYSVWVQERLNVGSRVRISHDILEGEKVTLEWYFKLTPMIELPILMSWYAIVPFYSANEYTTLSIINFDSF